MSRPLLDGWIEFVACGAAVSDGNIGYIIFSGFGLCLLRERRIADNMRRQVELIMPRDDYQ